MLARINLALRRNVRMPDDPDLRNGMTRNDLPREVDDRLDLRVRIGRQLFAGQREVMAAIDDLDADRAGVEIIVPLPG